MRIRFGPDKGHQSIGLRLLGDGEPVRFEDRAFEIDPVGRYIRNRTPHYISLRHLVPRTVMKHHDSREVML
jgi:hypothetical protein